MQTGLDQLEESRKTLLDRLLEIDQTMEKPKEEDIQRVRYCRNCKANDGGPLCVLCEVDELFRVCYSCSLVALLVDIQDDLKLYSL